jgi:amino acid transporter
MGTKDMERQELKKALDMKDVLALAFGTMIGWGWIMLAGKWVSLAGVWGAILAFAIGAVMCIFVGLCYAELTPMLPLAGGELVFSYRGLGYNASYVTGWFICLAYLGVACWEGPALAAAISYLIPFPMVGYIWTVAGFDVYLSWVMVGVVGGALLTYVNYRGVKSSAIFQTAATVAMAIGGICFLFGSVATGSVENLIPTFTGTSGLIAVLLMVPAMFVGFDVIPQAAEEMNIPLNMIAKVLIFSICMAAIWYMLMIISISFAAPGAIRDGAGIPVAESFAYTMGSPFFGKFMICAALCGILTSWNGFIIGTTRVLFAMGRAKMIPAVFGFVHPKYKTPTAAILLVGLFTVISPICGRAALVWFVDAAAFGTVVAYFMVSFSYIALRKNEPNIERPYRAPGGYITGVLAVLVAGFFLYLYLPIGPGALTKEEWILCGIWLILGVIFYIIAQLRYGKLPKEEMDFLMFGEKYTRYAVPQVAKNNNGDNNGDIVQE